MTGASPPFRQSDNAACFFASRAGSVGFIHLRSRGHPAIGRSSPRVYAPPFMLLVSFSPFEKAPASGALLTRPQLQIITNHNHMHAPGNFLITRLEFGTPFCKSPAFLVVLRVRVYVCFESKVNARVRRCVVTFTAVTIPLSTSQVRVRSKPRPTPSASFKRTPSHLPNVMAG